MLVPFAKPSADDREQTLRELRQMLAESKGPEIAGFSFGLAEVDAHMPQGGLPLGALHEFVPYAPEDIPAAFGFIAALLGRILAEKAGGLIFLITGLEDGSAYGRPYSHGLQNLGLDPARLLLVTADGAKQTQWALEETLRSALPVAVAGMIEGLGFRSSQRLQFAAENSGRPLLLLRPPGIAGSSVAVTRWRIGAASAVRDPFGLITHWRWRVTLERCRNGRPGEWLMEFDHAYRFGLAAAMADCPPSLGAIASSSRRTI